MFNNNEQNEHAWQHDPHGYGSKLGHHRIGMSLVSLFAFFRACNNCERYPNHEKYRKILLVNAIHCIVFEAMGRLEATLLLDPACLRLLSRCTRRCNRFRKGEWRSGSVRSCRVWWRDGKTSKAQQVSGASAAEQSRTVGRRKEGEAVSLPYQWNEAGA